MRCDGWMVMLVCLICIQPMMAARAQPSWPAVEAPPRIEVLIQAKASSPVVLEAAVLEPLEVKVRDLSGLDKIQSVVRAQTVVITLRFDPGQSGKQALQAVHEALDGTLAEMRREGLVVSFEIVQIGS